MKKQTRVSRIAQKTKEHITRAHSKLIEYNAQHNLGLGFWIFMLFVFILGVLFFSNISNFVEVIVKKYGYLGIFVTSLVTDTLVQPVGPDVPLVAGILLKLNPWMVFASVMAGAYCAILLTYYLGLKLGLPGIERIMGTNSYKKIQKYETKGKWFLFIGALTPVPYVPYLAGVWKLSFKDTLIYVAFPRTLRLFIVFVFAYYLGIILA